MTSTPDSLLRAATGRGLSLPWATRIVLALGLPVAVASGCGDNPEREFVIDCEGALENYELLEPSFQSFETTASWFGFGDCTPGATFDCIPGALDVTLDPMIVPEPIPGGRCDVSQQALVLRSLGHQDWGSGFGEFQTAQQQTTNTVPDGSEWDGIALWARSPGNTTKSVQITVSDINTHVDGGICLGCESHADCDNQTCLPDPIAGRERNTCQCLITEFLDNPDHCRPPTETTGCGTPCPFDQRSCMGGFCMRLECESAEDCNEAGGTPFCVDGFCSECEGDEDCTTELCGAGVCGLFGSCLFEDGADEDDTCGPVEVCDGTGPLNCTAAVQTGFIGEASGNPATLRAGNFCGNTFRRPLVVTENWELYFLPFDSFSQDPLPSRSPTGMDTSAIYQFGFQIPKEANLELWIDDITFYRRRAADDE
jgi:hypothetical protein